MRKRQWILSLLALTLVATACTGEISESAGEQNSDASASAGTAAPGTTTRTEIRIGVAALPPVIDAFASSAPPRSYFVRTIFSRLTDVAEDADGVLQDVPVLAESWQQVADDRWVFTLREGLTFSNGEPINADAVKFSMDYVLNPENNKTLRGRFGRVVGVSVVDALTVEVETVGNFPLLPRQIGLLSIVEPKSFTELGESEYWAAPVSSGPWLLEEFVAQESITLARNPNWSLEPPALERVRFVLIPEEAGRLAAIRTGEIDAANLISPQQLQLVADSAVRVVSGIEPSTYIVDLFATEGPLADVRVRQAISHAIDQESIVSSIMAGQALVAEAQLVHSALSGFCPTVTKYEFDPERAKALLAEAGFAGGDLSVTMQSSTGFFLNDALMAQAIQGMLGAVGIKVNVQVMEFSNFLDAYFGRAPRAELFGWRPGAEPLLDASMQAERFTTDYPTHNLGYSNSAYDDIVARAGEMELDDPERVELYCEAAQIIKDDAVVVPILHTPSIWVISDALEGFDITVLQVPTLETVSVQ